jgi:heterodisulfide reductase subunit A
MKTDKAMDYDVMVVGAGTAGMEASLSLGDMGYKVLLVEKEPSIGGRTILLSKVFPTLDCASCISTPKMASSAHHPNITLMTYSEVDGVTKNADGSFHVEMHKKPTYVDQTTCTGCGQCETACTVPIPDEYNYDMIARRAAHIPFPQAVPKKAVISRGGQAPCMHTCPAGVKPSGFVSLVRAGKYAEGFRLHLADAPLVGSLSRACYAPCEGECSRDEMEGSVNIRAIKRFMVDWYYDRHPEPEYGPVETQLDSKVAIIGSGPGGLTAAFHLAKQGHQVTVFESESHAGGMLRHGMPAYRMPNELLDRDIKNISALGVEIRTNTKVESIAALKEQGYDAVFFGVGNQNPRIIPITGKDLADVTDCMEFLKETNTGEQLPDIEGKDFVVLGGGNVALDVARAAVRMGTKSVSIVCLEEKDKMPAHDFEVREAAEEGVKLYTGVSTKRIYNDDSGKSMLEVLKVDTIEFTPEGRMTGFTTAEGSEQQIPADVVVMAIGLAPSTLPFENELDLNAGKTIQTNEQTLQTSDPVVFAGGDAVLGPSIICEAMGQGRKAAFYIDRQLKGESLDVQFESELEVADKDEIVSCSGNCSTIPPTALREHEPKKRIQSFEPYEETMTESEARNSANRCLGCGECSQCQECVNVCPGDCINFDMQPEQLEMTVGSVIVSTGYEILDPSGKELMGYGKYPNVISGPQMDRLLAPTRPYNGVLRPSDGKEPENIAIVLCNGSRDHTACNPLCCRIGCMYSAKHAQLVMGALPLADVTIYYIDIRAFGKGSDDFYEQSKGLGVQYTKGKAARIDEQEDGNLTVHYEDMEGEGGMQTAEHDMVVLTVGFLPNLESLKLFKGSELEADEFAYIKEPDATTQPGRTNIEGLFAAGTVIGARDIPDTVLHACASSAQAAGYIEQQRKA